LVIVDENGITEETATELRAKGHDVDE